MLPTVDDVAQLRAALKRSIPRPLCENDATRALEVALERLAHALRELDQKRLTLGFLGGTGVGKSTLLNAIAGAPIAKAGDRRPTTDRAVCYRHADFPQPTWLDPADVATGTEPHRVATLHGVILLDLPDIDSFEAKHRERVHRIVPRLDLLIVVTSVDKYADRTLYEELAHLRQAPRNVLFVLNAIDRLRTPDEQEKVAADFRAKLATHSRWNEPRILSLSARNAFEKTATAASAGLAPLLDVLTQLDTDSVRRSALAANAEAYASQFANSWDESLPAGRVDAWLAELAALPTALPDPPVTLLSSLRDDLEDAIAPWLSDRALRASAFPLGWIHFVIRRFWPGRVAGRVPDPFVGAADPGARYAEEVLERPLRLATHALDKILRQSAEKFAFEPLEIVAASSSTASAAATQWADELRRRAPRLAWRFRQHILPGIALALTLGWLVAPAHKLADERGWMSAAWNTVWQALERLSPMQWSVALLTAALYYLLLYPYFLYRMEQRAGAAARRGAELLAADWRAAYRARFGEPLERRVAGLRRWWEELAALREKIEPRP
ncbi:MAG: GTPase [Planctomycetota bacterium]